MRKLFGLFFERKSTTLKNAALKGKARHVFFFFFFSFLKSFSYPVLFPNSKTTKRLLEARLGKKVTEEKTAGTVAASAALSAIPFGLAAVGSVVNAAISKRCHHRKWFIIWPAVVCALGLGVLGPLIEVSGVGAFVALIAAAQGFSSYGKSFVFLLLFPLRILRGKVFRKL